MLFHQLLKFRDAFWAHQCCHASLCQTQESGHCSIKACSFINWSRNSLADSLYETVVTHLFKIFRLTRLQAHQLFCLCSHCVSHMFLCLFFSPPGSRWRHCGEKKRGGSSSLCNFRQVIFPFFCASVLPLTLQKWSSRNDRKRSCEYRVDLLSASLLV